MKIMKDKSYTEKPKELKNNDVTYKYKFEELLIQFDIKVNIFREILTNILSSDSLYHSEALGEQKYNYLKDIIYKLTYYGFTYSQIFELFLQQVSKKSISKWVNEEDRDEKRLPAQFYYKLKLSDDKKKIKEAKLESNEINAFIEKILTLDCTIYTFDATKDISYITLKKMTAVSRKVNKKLIFIPPRA